MTWEEAGLVSEDIVINRLLHYLASANIHVPKLQLIKNVLESEQLGSIFAVTKRPNEKVVGIHAVRESAEIQRDIYNREFPDEEYGVVEWLIRDETR